MEAAMIIQAAMTAQQNQQIHETVQRERSRLLDFIRRRVPSDEDAEDILQDVFYQLVHAYRTMEPIEKVTSWLFTVARNRITDFFRKKKSPAFSSFALTEGEDDAGDAFFLEEVMQDVSESPEGTYMRGLVWDTLQAALDELPPEQRNVFVQHELEGISFNQMAEDMNLSINTLLSRKRYAVLHLRKRLQTLYDELLTE